MVVYAELEYAKKILALSASICTIGQFLTGLPICYKIYRTRSTGALPSLPFVSGLLSCFLWFRYGSLVEEDSIILVNFTGTVLFLSYVLVYFRFAAAKTTVFNQCLGCMAICSVVLIYIHGASETDARYHLGIICSCVTIAFFASPLATLLEVIKLKSTETMPFPIILAGFLVTVQWYIYGLLIEDKFVQIPNFLGSILLMFQLGLFCVYPNAKKKADFYDNA